jgi:hypothetical protein
MTEPVWRRPPNPSARLLWTLFHATLGSSWPEADALVNGIRAHGVLRYDGQVASVSLQTPEGRFRITVVQESAAPAAQTPASLERPP